MVEQGSELSMLARFGIRDPARAVRELPSGWVKDPRWSALLELVGDRAPDPDVALRRLCGTPPDIVEAVLSDPDKAAPMVAVLGFSEYLSGLVSRLPGAAGVLLGGDGPRQETLRDLKDERLLQIAARDLSSAPDRDSLVRTGHELSDLADDCLRTVIETAGAEGMAVMAMGKLGGRELNYASDIDVLFVHRTGGDEAEAAAKRVMEAMNGPPVIFRTDADLRPEGRDGPLVRSLDAFAAYYRRWAQVWEFQSLIKCRFSAGDQSVGDDFLELVRPFVWPERLAPEAVEQVRALKSRAEAQVHRAGLSGRQVKLGRGGIRDVEFAVQLLQLVHGRHHPDLRVRNTLEALDVLGHEGFVAEQDADDLADAYVFLRHTEHRLQLISGRQTHTLPTQPARLEHVARGLGLRDSSDGSALDEFDGRWRHTTSVVRRIHERLFYRPLLEAFAQTPAIGPALGAEEARDRLAALGFDRPQRAQDLIVSLTSGPSRSTRVMRAILPGLLAWLSETPDPDAGLVRLRDLVSRLESLPHLLAMLRDEPPVAELACRAVGTGPVLASLMQREPGLVADLLPDRPGADREAFVREAVSVASRTADTPGAVSALRRLKDSNWLRLAAADLSSGREPEVFVRLAAELSDVADACLEAALVVARREADGRTGGPPPGGFAVVGMGRLGGRELSLASDLDVIFVYERDGSCPDGSEGRLYHAFVAERMTELLASVPPIFKVDPELRPEGRSGPIVRSLDSCRQYYERWAQGWEFQALVRARHAAGDESVSSALLEAVAPRVWPPELTGAEVEHIRHLKARIERERVRSRDDPKLQLKLGIGGLSDVEFTVQLMQRRHGHAHPGLRTPNTLEAIERLAALDLVGDSDRAWLREAYLVLNRVRNHLFLLRGLPTDVLPSRDEDLERLARSLGYGRLSRAGFLDDYRRITRRARRVCDRLFYGEDESGPAPA